MRVLFAIASLVLLTGCVSIVQQVHDKVHGMQVAFGPCRLSYARWQRQVERGSFEEVRASERALVTCLRANNVVGPIDLVMHDVYGATPPPHFGPGQPRRDLEVEGRAIPLMAHHYTP